jgi:hypothetical protein
MKDKLPNDRLEEFLRKSLGDHSEEPPGDLWSKIAENLEPPVVVQPRLSPVRGWRAMAAAAALLLGLLVAQHLYFDSKLNQMSRKLEQNEQEIKQLEEDKTAALQRLESENRTEETVENTVATQNTDSKDFDQTYVLEGSPHPLPPKNKVVPANAERNSETGKSQLNEAGKSQQQPVEKAEIKSNEEGLVNEVMEPSPAPDEAEVAQTTGNDLQRIWTKKLSALDLPATPAPFIGMPIIPASKLLGHNYAVGMNAMPMISKNSISGVKPHGHGMGGMDDRKSFKVNSEKSEHAWMAGVALEAKVAPNLRVGTGLNYRTVDYKTSHLINFDFKDRRHGGGHSNDNEHDFEYDLSTAVGNIEMEVRAVSDETASNIPDNTKVLAKISTSEHLSYVSVPVYVNYSFGNGRLRALAKAGVLLNFIKDNEFNIDQVKSLTTRFEFKEKERNSGSPANIQTVTVDYLAGVGLEYKLSNAFSLRLEPSIIGSLTSRHNNPRIQSSEFSAGMNAGVMYNF